MLKRKVSKIPAGLKRMLKSGNSRKYLTCKECSMEEVEVAQDIKAVTCAYCVQRQVAPPPQVAHKEEGEKFPRGWALKATYIHTDGRIFEKGKDTGKKYTPANPAEIIPPKKVTPVDKNSVVAKKRSKKVKSTTTRKKRK